jgi:hypothetical protein
MTWDPLPGFAGEYEIYRRVPGGEWARVGVIPAPYIGGDEEAGIPGEPAHLNAWPFARDVPFPVEGQLYEYTVRACYDGFTPRCGPIPPEPSFRYRAACYVCLEAGREVPCYTSAPLKLPQRSLAAPARPQKIPWLKRVLQRRKPR